MVIFMCSFIQYNSYFHGIRRGKNVPLNYIKEGDIHLPDIGRHLRTTYNIMWGKKKKRKFKSSNNDLSYCVIQFQLQFSADYNSRFLDINEGNQMKFGGTVSTSII